jgi:uncharacterized membrane protein
MTVEPNGSSNTDEQTLRSGLVRGLVLPLLTAVCMVVATASVAFIAVQERKQTQCAQATANANAWIAVNVVARDFNKEVSLAENRAAVAAVDKRLKGCLPSGR